MRQKTGVYRFFTLFSEECVYTAHLIDLYGFSEPFGSFLGMNIYKEVESCLAYFLLSKELTNLPFLKAIFDKFTTYGGGHENTITQ
jgi:hypothetical protein